MNEYLKNFEDFCKDILSEGDCDITTEELWRMYEIERVEQHPKTFFITDTGREKIRSVIENMKQIAEKSRSKFYVEYEPIPGLAIYNGEKNPVAVTGFFSRICIDADGVIEALQQIKTISKNVIIRTAADEGTIIILRDIGDEAIVKYI